MKWRTTLTAGVLVLAGIVSFTAPSPADAGQQAPAKADSTHLLIVAGRALTPDGLRNLPRGMELHIVNHRTQTLKIAIIGETDYGVYETVFFDTEEMVAVVGDTLTFSIPDAEFAPDNGWTVLSQEEIDLGMVRYDVVPDMISAVPDANVPGARVDSFPNPFNPSTTIRLRHPVDGPATVVVHDLRGHGVRTLYRGYLEAGEHRLAWDGRDHLGRDLASGAYLVVYRGAKHAAAHRVLLVR